MELSTPDLRRTCSRLDERIRSLLEEEQRIVGSSWFVRDIAESWRLEVERRSSIAPGDLHETDILSGAQPSGNAARFAAGMPEAHAHRSLGRGLNFTQHKARGPR
jgi:hypothetical protein